MFTWRRPRPGKCFAVAATPRRPHPLDRRPRARRDHGAPAKRAIRGGHRAAGRVGDRREVDVHAGAAQLAGGRARGARGPGRRSLQRLWPTGRPSRPCARRRPPGRPSRARRCAPALERPVSAATAPGSGVEAEQDHARGLAGAAGGGAGSRRRRALEARDRQLADLLAQAEAVDRRPLRPASGAGRPVGSAAWSLVRSHRRRRPPGPAAPRATSSASRRRAAGSADSRTLGAAADAPEAARLPSPRARPSGSPRSAPPARSRRRGRARPCPAGPLGRLLGAPGEDAARERVAVDAGQLHSGQLAARPSRRRSRRCASRTWRAPRRRVRRWSP